MLKKKLLTLACALGILACGACFLPPDRSNPPPLPPPLRESLRRIRTIRVEAANQAGPGPINPVDLALAVATDINANALGRHVRARVASSPECDAHLQVTIQSETASHTSGVANWHIAVGVSSILSGRDGRVLWSETHFYSLNRPFAENAPDQLWQHKEIQSWLAWSLVKRMLNGD
jgi:hypothetical protein